MNYIVVKILADDTFVTEFFREWATAKKYIAKTRAKSKDIVKDCFVYKKMDY